MKRITYSKLAIAEFEQFFSFFEKSIHTQFPEYQHNSCSYITEVDYNKSWMRGAIKNGSRQAYIAKDNNRIIGYIFANLYAGISTAHWIAVDQQYQKQGVASQLLKNWEEDAIQLGSHSLQLWTSEPWRVQFYKNRGFILSGEFPQAWFGLDMHLFHKPLQKPKEENFLREYLQNKKEQ